MNKRTIVSNISWQSENNGEWTVSMYWNKVPPFEGTRCDKIIVGSGKIAEQQLMIYKNIFMKSSKGVGQQDYVRRVLYETYSESASL